MKRVIYPTTVKICGIRESVDALSALQKGVTRLGLVFYQPSPRAITLEQAMKLVEAVDHFLKNNSKVDNVSVLQRPLVMVTVDMSLVKLLEIFRQTGKRVGRIQLHGSESAEYIGHLRQILKTCHWPEPEIVRRISSPMEKNEFMEITDMLLWESPGRLPGGNGILHQWPAPEVLTPADRFIIAGGLKVDNILTALTETNVNEVDVSGGVENHPGIKSIEKIDQFMNRIRQYNRQKTKSLNNTNKHEEP